MGLFDKLLQLFTNAEVIRDQYTGISLEEILGFINEEDELRFYVDGTPNFGHQATTINLMKRIIDRAGYAGKIKVVYADAEEGTSTPKKLALLLTGLIPAQINTAQIAYGTCNDITFLNFSEADQIRTTVRFGFTGGADNMDEKYAQILKTDYFLRLQPYLWDDDFDEKDVKDEFETSTVEQLDGKVFYFGEDAPNFKSLAYKFPKEKYTAVPASVWTWYGETQTYDANLKIRTNNAKAIYDSYKTKDCQLWPIYGLHQFSSENMNLTIYQQAEMVIGFILSAYPAQLKVLGRPIVAMALNDTTVLKSLLHYATPFSADLAAKDYKLTRLEAAIKSAYEIGASEAGDEYSEEYLSNFIARLSVDIKPIIDAGCKLTLLKGSDNSNYINIAEQITSALSDAAVNEFIFITLGPVPVDVYNYLYANSGLPGIYEGQGTSSLMISQGKPFLQLTRLDSGISNNYPSTLISTNYSTVSNTANKACLVLRDNTFEQYLKKTDPSDAKDYYPKLVTVANFIVNSRSAESEEGVYFKNLGIYYQKDIHDKAMLGLVGVDSLILLKQKALMEAEMNGGGGMFHWDNGNGHGALEENGKTLTLEEVYNDLVNQWSDGSINLISALPETYLSNFFKKVTGNLFNIVVAKENIQKQYDGGTVTKVTLTNGRTNAFESIGIPEFKVNLTFTQPIGPVITEVDATVDEVWTIDGIPWMEFGYPGFTMKVNEGGMPVSGGLKGTVVSAGMELLINYPVSDKTWLINGSFIKDFPGISTFYQMAGGINLVESLPSPLNALAGFGLKNIQLMYNQSTMKFDYMSFEMTTSTPWVISQNPLLQILPTVDVQIYNVQEVARRRVEFSVTGKFTIGKGTITVNGTYPAFGIYGGLSSGVILLSDLLALFGGELDMDIMVTEFNFAYQPERKYYEIGAALEADKPLVIVPGLISIFSLSFNVENNNNTNKVSLGGMFTVLPDTQKIDISLSALYVSNKGWTFKGKQTAGVLKIGELLGYYLGNGWKPPQGQDLTIEGLAFQVSTATKYWQFEASTAEDWQIPFINLSISGNALIGYGKKSETAVEGNYGNINADIDWYGIAMNLFFDYAPGYQSYGFTWNFITGFITEKEVVPGQPKHWVGTLKFTKSVTLGYIVEEAISWATGTKFGLAAPWSLLNSLSLDKLELIYDFTAKSVSFALNIGEIDLGFCKIKKIGINYLTGQQKAEENGMFVTIDGSFFWITDENAVPGQTPDQLKWDAAKPESTPAPSGTGNKYLDLRLLALGQHVTIPGFKNVTSVQEAIKEMEKLPDTEPGKIPDIIFDPDSSWLVGMDFGILKLEPPKQDNLTAAAAASGYFIDLQAVFNDPALYALRIALSGEPARIFKGLDFQILYRKISDSVGVYQAEIALPEVMRRIQLGQVNITLPIFAIEIYTNGDFLVDLGFPKNADFSRSFTLQTIIYVPVPIPVMGSAGLYFGKKSSATSTEVPVIDNGVFNPVLVFGVGLQIGLGYDFNAGILAAGFSLTFVTIIEGVLAKFNSYQAIDTSTGNQSDIAPAYYYKIKGVVGIQGKLYGYIDFKIIKAEVNVLLSVLADITIAAYEPILLGLTAKVSVSVSIKINLGIFTIRISFSFDLTIRQSFEIPTGGGTAPWHITSGNVAQQIALNGGSYSKAYVAKLRRQSFFTELADSFTDMPDWNNLTVPAEKKRLYGYIGCGLSMAGDLAKALAEQQAVYTAMLFIDTVPSAAEAPKAIGEAGAGKDTSFEMLSKQVFRWLIAAFHQGAISEEEVDKLAISEVRLQEIYNYLNNAANAEPIPFADISNFLARQVTMSISHPSGNSGEANAAYFPVVPDVNINLPAFGSQKALNYNFGNYNTLSESYLQELRAYFDELTVKMQEEAPEVMEALSNDKESLATFIFSDYFLLLSRQMVQNAQNALKDFQYEIVNGQTTGDIVNWVNTNGQFGNKYTYTLNDLFDNNKSHVLRADKKIRVSGSAYNTVANETFESISAQYQFKGGFTPQQLASYNADNSTILQAGATVQYPGKDPVIVQAGNTLNVLASDFGVSLDELISNSDVVKKQGLLMPSVWLELPDFDALTQAGDTLIIFSARYGVSIISLANEAANLGIADLYDTASDSRLVFSDLPQFQVGELIKEIQLVNGLQQLSGMTSRYYLSGLRLPVAGITPNYQGMWVNDKMKFEQDNAGLFSLTGQQFPLPELVAGASYEITFTITQSNAWLSFDGGNRSLVISVKENTVDYEQIRTVRKYANNNYLDLMIQKLGMGSMFESHWQHYAFNTVIPWLAGSPVVLPYKGNTGEVKSVSLWTLPDGLLNLADPIGRAVAPRFQVRTGAVNPSTKSVDSKPVSNYGWGTQVNFTVKRVPVSPDSPASLTTYEIAGADGDNALVLERMVTALGTDGTNDALINLLMLGYAPYQSNGANPGVQTDPAGKLTFGIAQVNLSTFTRPEGLLTTSRGMEEGAETITLLNRPTEFITLLWQASITRNGGYYLYYYNSENNLGLPDHAFNDKGEAELTLIVLYSAPAAAEKQNLLQPYMNLFATGDPVNTEESTLFAQADPVKQTAIFTEGDTLNRIAYKYFTNPGDVAEDNATAPLTQDILINVPEGTYQVGKDGSGQGETLQSIADKFNTTVKAIEDANPVVKQWPAVLPVYFGLRLPPLVINTGRAKSAATLIEISQYYGMDLTALANYNGDVLSLFAKDTTLAMRGGPATRTATVPAGVASLEAVRTKPQDIPVKPSEADYAKIFLQNYFSVLSFRLTDNSWFRASKPSLPAGPTKTSTQEGNLVSFALQDNENEWRFQQSVPYYKFANQTGLQTGSLPGIDTSPYKGIGYLVQPDFSWLDVYGNTIMTTLSVPPSKPDGIMNQKPVLTGYTDALLGLNQWPSVAAAWDVASKPRTEIRILLTFDTTAYNGLLSAKAVSADTLTLSFSQQVDRESAAILSNYKLSPSLDILSATVEADGRTVTLKVAAMQQESEYTLAIGNISNSDQTDTFNGQATFSYPEVASASTSSVIQQAQRDLQVYTQLWYQLTDPNGIAMSMHTTLYGQAFAVDNAAFESLKGWIASIYSYLEDRSEGRTTTPAPASSYVIAFQADPLAVNTEQIFELQLSFSIERTGGAVQADFETTGSVKKVTTQISPLSKSVGGDTLGLNEFAQSFEKAMSVEGKYYLKTASGVNRSKLGEQKPDGTIWAVRLGIDDQGPIAYKVNTPGSPVLFAPRPVSNKLESRPGVEIYNYTTGTGIDFSKYSYKADFSGVDTDQWVLVFFNAMDNLLTPAFTASIQLVDKRLGTAYLKKLQQQKESLADIAKQLMTGVFAGEPDDAAAPVQEAFRQSLLEKLSNLYNTNAGIVFDTSVKADVVADTPPNLYGNFLQNTVLIGAAANEADLKKVMLLFSAPLNPQTAVNASSYTLSDGNTVASATLQDEKTVVLTTSGNVTINSTKVTIASQNFLDADNREIQGSRTTVIATEFVSYNKADQLTVTAAKIKLEKGDKQPLAFLLNAPQIVRSAEGEVLSRIDLNLSYKGSDIEHQIAHPVNGFTPSSWLSFVLPDTHVPLESQLGSFSVPMFLRSFPQSPSLINQTGTTPDVENPDISKLLEWSYSFMYLQTFHYPQDTLYFTVNFNVSDESLANLGSFPDAFPQLAEFVTVYPSVEKDLKEYVTKIDAKVYNSSGQETDKLFQIAGTALRSFAEMTAHIVEAADKTGLSLKSERPDFSSNGVEPYLFHIREKGMSLGGKQVQVVSVYGTPPAGVGMPQVLIEPEVYEMKQWTNQEDPCDGTVCYFYVNKITQEPLLSEEGQQIQERIVVLPQMNILQRQDAMTTVYLTRNEDLVPGKSTNPEFVYTTGEIAFSNPYLPTVNSRQQIELANLPQNQNQPTTRSLYDQLKTLMSTLLAANTEPVLWFQMTCSYDYSINKDLAPVNLPVLMQAMVKVDLAAGLDKMLMNWTEGITQWFGNNLPNEVNGAFRFELVIFSNLTIQPYPLVRLYDLVLSLEYISPPLMKEARVAE